MSKVYYQGESVREKAHVTNAAGAFIDPNTIVITIVDSEDAKKEDAEPMTWEALGNYFYDYLIPTDAALGKWKVEIKASTEFIAIEQDEFTVLEAIV